MKNTFISMPYIWQPKHFFAYKPLFLSLMAMLATTGASAFADELTPTNNTTNQTPVTKIDLPSIAVTGNPLGLNPGELIVPVSILNGRELSFIRESTLGDTLNGIPGASMHRSLKIFHRRAKGQY